MIVVTGPSSVPGNRLYKPLSSVHSKVASVVPPNPPAFQPLMQSDITSTADEERSSLTAPSNDDSTPQSIRENSFVHQASSISPDGDGHGSEVSAEGTSESIQSEPSPAETKDEKPLARHHPELTVRTGETSNNKAQFEDDEAPQSVIHAPPGFGEFRIMNNQSTNRPKMQSESHLLDSDFKVEQSTPKNVNNSCEMRITNSPISPAPLTTTIAPAKDWSDRATPRAQTRQEIENLETYPHTKHLEDIPESSDVDNTIGEDVNETSESRTQITENLQDDGKEIEALRTALTECWTFCNTLASLSSIHRERLFNISNQGTMQEQAWKSCWKLCQKLYDSQEDDYAAQVRPTLDLCREFCQALFEVRIRDNEVADSVLRVSFELNNHLYNTHDRNLPEAFRERTLDFYITLCHRLMKQRMHLADEADSLLHACWSLAEMLFSIRQNKKEGVRPDEELLGSAIQACWELCDLFREGWTQIRPDRGTPRPSQTTFTEAFHLAKQSSADVVEDLASQMGNPETPTTIFEDTATISPDEAPIPNILVLGQSQAPAARTKWSSNASTLSGRSRSSEHTSSTKTLTSPSEDLNLVRLKILVYKAAINSGYQRGASQTFLSFVKSLSSDSFGTLPWQISLLENYKRLVISDPAFRVIRPSGEANAVDISQAVEAMVHDGRYTWLKDLYRLVLGFHTEEAANRRTVSVQI